MVLPHGVFFLIDGPVPRVGDNFSGIVQGALRSFSVARVRHNAEGFVRFWTDPTLDNDDGPSLVRVDAVGVAKDVRRVPCIPCSIIWRMCVVV